MSHRALVAVARADGRFDVLPWRNGAEEAVLARLRAPDARLPPGVAEGRPLGRTGTFEDVLATFLDPVEHEALLVAEPDGRVTPYAVLAYVLATGDGLVEGDPAGAVLALVGDDGSTLHPAYVRGWTHGTAGVLGEAVDGDLLTAAEALAWLGDRARRLAGDQYAFAPVPARRG